MWPYPCSSSRLRHVDSSHKGALQRLFSCSRSEDCASPRFCNKKVRLRHGQVLVSRVEAAADWKGACGHKHIRTLSSAHRASSSRCPVAVESVRGAAEPKLSIQRGKEKSNTQQTFLAAKGHSHTSNSVYMKVEMLVLLLQPRFFPPYRESSLRTHASSTHLLAQSLSLSSAIPTQLTASASDDLKPAPRHDIGARLRKRTVRSDGLQKVFRSRRTARPGSRLGRSAGKDVHKMVGSCLSLRRRTLLVLLGGADNDLALPANRKGSTPSSNLDRSLRCGRWRQTSRMESSSYN